MIETSVPPRVLAETWTCPFCLLLCDSSSVEADASGRLALRGPGCRCATKALAHFTDRSSEAVPRLDGRDCSLDEAVSAAARVFAASRQPLFGGLGTEVSGARALYRLACATGAISDAAGGAAQMHTLRAMQDRGHFYTTLAEVRARADLIVCVGGTPLDYAPDCFERFGVGEAQVPQRHVLVLGGDAADDAALATLATRPGVTVSSVPLQGDLYETVATLSALVAKRQVRDPAAGLVDLAARLKAAKYAVIVGVSSRLPTQGALVVEGVNRIVGTLNAKGRAAAMWLGGGQGAGTVSQVWTWLSGLPLRSRAGPLGLEHEPLCFDAKRLLAEKAVDSLLWVSSFGPDLPAPDTDLPIVLLGHPELAVPKQSKRSVFIPVSTPGIGSAGHLFRADGSVMMPLHPVYADTLPTLQEVVARITREVLALKEEGRP